MKLNFKFDFSIITVILLSFFTPSCSHHAAYVEVIKKPLNSPKDILPVNDSLVKPYVYTSVVSLNTLPVNEKKKKFFQMLLPAVLVAKTDMQLNRERVKRLLAKNEISPAGKLFLDSLEVKYKTANATQLLTRLHVLPVSIVLGQAAIESGWGSSRFFLKANNPFGIWSFDKNHQRIEASSHRNGQKIYLRKFNDLEAAIDAYYIMLATRKPFAQFRTAKLKTQNPFQLIRYLGAYSERGDEYLNELAKVIRVNDLEKYDHYKIDPEYLR